MPKVSFKETESGKVLCPECGKEYSVKGIHTHIWRTHGEGRNWTANNDGYKTGSREPWNKGLDKSDPRVRKNAISVQKSLKKLYDSGYRSPTQTEEYWTEERRKAKSSWKKELHRKHPELHPNRLLANNRNKMTYPEKVAYDYLVSKGIEFEHQKPIAGFFVDFCINSVIIEIDGEHWHPEGNDKDAHRDQILKNEGYTVYRIRSKEQIEDRIQNILSVV